MLNKIRGAVTVLALISLFHLPPAAAQNESEAPTATGVNDSFLTADAIGAFTGGNTLVVSGDIYNIDQGPRDRDYFSFLVTTPGFVQIDLLGYDTPGDTTLTLFDPFLYLYDSSQTLINNPDDDDDLGGGEEGFDPDGAGPLPFHNALNARTIQFLNPGTYFAVAANAPTDDDTVTTTQSLTRYRLEVGPSAVVIPEPGTCALLTTGLLPLLGTVLRRRKR